jgi:hypothetical protein
MAGLRSQPKGDVLPPVSQKKKHDASSKRIAIDPKPGVFVFAPLFPDIDNTTSSWVARAIFYVSTGWFAIGGGLGY